jgi:hypothetical protein
MGNAVSSAHVADETAAHRPLKRQRVEKDTASVMEPPSKMAFDISPTTQPMKNFRSSDLIGLKFTDGAVRYIHQSTLVNAGGYFSKRFGDNGIPAGEATKDSDGVSIYFVERDGKLFDNHILPFIIGKTPGELPPFSQRPGLWCLVREEAQFFALDDLYKKLHIIHSCPYSIGDDRGVLYWLGTGKGTHEYKNPYSNNAVAVHVGKLGDLTLVERSEIYETHHIGAGARAFLPESRAALVQYRPPIRGYDEERHIYNVDALDKCYSLWCGMSLCKVPTIVDLRTIS